MVFFEGVNRILLLCREIVLYNEFVPAMEHELHQLEYSVYGHYDGIGIGKIIKFDDCGYL
jgi:hypothetical protein